MTLNLNIHLPPGVGHFPALKNIYIMYLFMCLYWSSLLHACRLSLVMVSGGYSLIVVGGLLIAVASLVAVHGSVDVAPRFRCPMAHGIFLDQGSNPSPLHWQVDSQPLSHQGSPSLPYFNGGTALSLNEK